MSVQVFLTLKAMKKATKTTADGRADAKPADRQDPMFQAILGQACKQNIDRGVAANVLTLIYHKIANDELISKEVVEEVIGVVVGRAMAVDRRAIILDRIMPVITALTMVEGNGALKTELNSYLSDGTAAGGGAGAGAGAGAGVVAE